MTLPVAVPPDAGEPTGRLGDMNRAKPVDHKMRATAAQVQVLGDNSPLARSGLACNAQACSTSIVKDAPFPLLHLGSCSSISGIS